MDNLNDAHLFKYRVNLRPEMRDTELEEYFNDGEEISLKAPFDAEELQDNPITCLLSKGQIREYEEYEWCDIVLAFKFTLLSKPEPQASEKPVTEATAVAILDEEEEHDEDAEDEAVVNQILFSSSGLANEKAISLVDCEDYECASVYVNGELVFKGNYWDFNAGSMGTEIAGLELNKVWDEGIESLVAALKHSFTEIGFTVTSEAFEVNEATYNALDR